MLYYFYVAGIYIARVLPIRSAYAVAEFIAMGYYYCSSRTRELLKYNLSIVMGDDLDEKTLDRHARKVFKNFGKYLADFFRFSRYDEKYMSEYIKVDGIEKVEKAMELGKGVVVVSLHLGNWELGGAVVAGKGFPLNAIVLEHGNKKINEFFIDQRAINNMKSIPTGMAVKQCFKALKRNELVAIVGDKDYTDSSINADFFGKKPTLPKGPAVVSAKTGAPIIFIVLARNEDDTFTLHVEGPITSRPTGNTGEDMEVLTAKYVKIFEKYIRMYPDQWYACEPIWKQQ